MRERGRQRRGGKEIGERGRKEAKVCVWCRNAVQHREWNACGYL